jgi:hypothetical protein
MWVLTCAVGLLRWKINILDASCEGLGNFDGHLQNLLAHAGATSVLALISISFASYWQFRSIEHGLILVSLIQVSLSSLDFALHMWIS